LLQLLTLMFGFLIGNQTYLGVVNKLLVMSDQNLVRKYGTQSILNYKIFNFLTLNLTTRLIKKLYKKSLLLLWPSLLIKVLQK